MTRRTSRPSRMALAAAAGAFWAVHLVLHQVLDLPLADSVMVATLLVVVPGLALAQLPLVDHLEIERVPAYWGSIVSLWLLGGAAWLVGTRDGGAAAIGLRSLPLADSMAWTGGLTAAALGIILAFHALSRLTDTADTPLLRALLPRTAHERGVFAVLSVAAGVCEELAYRGYLITVLTPTAGVVGAAAVSTVAFGVVHAYQGGLGVVRTGLMGGVLAWGFLASGSLWPAIVAHVLLDLLAGIVIGERLLSPAPSNGVAAPEPFPDR